MNSTVAQADGQVRECGIVEVVLVEGSIGTRGWRHGRKQQCVLPLWRLRRGGVAVSESELNPLLVS